MIVTTRKTNKQVTIPLHSFVKAIVKKYNGKLPQSVDKAHTIEQLQLCGKLAGIDDDVQINRIRGGKTLIQQGKKYEFIKNHTARRSFATNMYLKNVPTISIMAITGHTTEANFMKYIKVDQEQHAKIVEGYFEK
jgi:integrase